MGRTVQFDNKDFRREISGSWIVSFTYSRACNCEIFTLPCFTYLFKQHIFSFILFINNCFPFLSNVDNDEQLMSSYIEHL